MATYIIMTRFGHNAAREPRESCGLDTDVRTQIRQECPNVRWKESYALHGTFDAMDVVETDRPEEVEKAAVVIRGYGKSLTQTSPATPWDRFLAHL